MIPEPVISPQTDDWKQSLSESLRSIQDLRKYCGLDVNRPESGSEAGFPLRVTKYYASLIEKGNDQDPLLLQVLPDQKEYQRIEGYSLDAVGDMNAMPVPGLIHKYDNRVLLTLTGACPIHCRYCFRRHFPYNEARLDISTGSPVLNYLTQHPEIKEVILSGGDPLMLSDKKLSGLISSLNKIPHIRYLRFHTRLLSVLPNRVSDSFIQTVRQFNGKVTFITHINHPNEIDKTNQQAFQRLSQHGFKLFNQSVLLKGINDKPQVLIDLSYKLYDSDITAYYLHSLDKVHGAAHFDITSKQQCQIYAELTKKLPGYLLPKLVREISGQQSKTPVQCL